MIRKSVLLCLSILTGCLCLQAQKKVFEREFTLGASAGVSFSSVSFSPSVKQNMLLTYNGGLTARWITESHCGMQLELNYAQWGWDEQFDESEWKYARRLNYVELPFLAHFNIGNRRVRAFLNLGPQIGYLISESSSYNLESLDQLEPPNNVHVAERKKYVENKLSWGLGGGPGVEIRTGIGFFLIEGRYFYSLGDIFKNSKSDYFARSAPQVISVKLSYLIPLHFKRLK